MKTRTIVRVGKLVLVALLVASPAAQAGSGQYQLLIRAPWAAEPGSLAPAPISKVRIMLLTNRNPANNTITIGSSTNPSLNLQVTVPSPGIVSQTVAGPDLGDSVQVTALGQAIVINFWPNSMLNPNRCTALPGAMDKVYHLDWSDNGGDASMSGSRLTSYYGLNTGTSSPDCSACAVRAVELHADWTQFPFNKFGRNPMDVALVIDKSGSMSNPPAGSGGVAKWQALQDTVRDFITDWQTAAGHTNGLDQDRLAFVLFDEDTRTWEDTGPGRPFWVARDATAGGTWEDLKGYMPTVMPYGATAMGKGLGVAYQKKDGTRDTAAVLVTDGLQNVDPYIVGLEPPEADLTVHLQGEPNPRVLKQECVAVHTVAIDTVVLPETERLLNKISAQTRGQYGEAVRPSDRQFLLHLLEDVGGFQFVQALSGIVGGPDTPRAPGRAVSPATADTVANTLSLELDSSIRSALVILQWSPYTPDSAPLDLRARSPYAIIQPSARANSPGQIVMRIDLPAAGPAGNWSFDVMAGAVPGETSYTLTVLADEKSLDLQTRVPGIRHVTGEPLTIETYVGLEGVPVEGRAKLEATLTRPAVALGTILHDAQVATPAPDASQDARSPYEAKVRAVLAAPALLEKALKKEKKEKLKFKYAGHGRYVLTLDSVDVPGTYRFDIALEIPMPRGERIRRITSVQTVVEAFYTPFNAGVTPLGGGRYQVRVSPRDAFGHYAGPGKTLVATVSRGKVAGVTDPQVKGDYVVELVNVTGNPTLTLALDGSPLGSKPLSQWDSRLVVPWDKPRMDRAKILGGRQRPGQRTNLPLRERGRR